jgi:uncharacterized protein (TIGR02117 family)
VLKKIFLFVVTISALITVPTFIPLGAKPSGGKITIYLISNEIHTDLVLPVKNEVFDWESFWSPEDFGSRPGAWVEIGWGDKEFYRKVPTWDDFTYSVALKALFLPGDAAIHVNYLSGNPDHYPHSARLEISPETYQKLVRAIKSQFVSSGETPSLVLNSGYSDTDNFYEAHGVFSIFKTCNVWTGNILAQAGLRHPLWSPTKYGLEFIWFE